MPEWLTGEFWQARATPAVAWLNDNLFTAFALLQLGVVLLALAIAHFLAKPLKRVIKDFGARKGWRARPAHAAGNVAVPVIWLIFVELAMGAARLADLPFYILKTAASLLSAWIVITLVAELVRNRALSRVIAIIAWSLAALNILGLLNPAIAILETMAVSVGEVRISALNIVSALLIFVVLFWAAIASARLLDRQLTRSTSITPSLQVLFSKLAKIVFITLAVILGMTASGIDLTAFAVFGGAVGLGLGFGLQKVVSNLVSGVILLMDRSIKPGDVIEFGQTYGWINKLAARYTSVVTRNGTEYLIPNEDMITQPVINWSHSNRQVRRSIPVGVSYRTDIRRAMALMEEAGRETERILDAPAPRCLLKGFGDSSVDLELRIWIEDPQNGVSNVASDVLLKIWDKFQAEGVEIPFPQRDLHIVSAEGLAAGPKENEIL